MLVPCPLVFHRRCPYFSSRLLSVAFVVDESYPRGGHSFGLSVFSCHKFNFIDFFIVTSSIWFYPSLRWCEGLVNRHPRLSQTVIKGVNLIHSRSSSLLETRLYTVSLAEIWPGRHCSGFFCRDRKRGPRGLLPGWRECNLKDILGNLGSVELHGFGIRPLVLG